MVTYIGPPNLALFWKNLFLVPKSTQASLVKSKKIFLILLKFANFINSIPLRTESRCTKIHWQMKKPRAYHFSLWGWNSWNLNFVNFMSQLFLNTLTVRIAARRYKNCCRRLNQRNARALRQAFWVRSIGCDTRSGSRIPFGLTPRLDKSRRNLSFPELYHVAPS